MIKAKFTAQELLSSTLLMQEMTFINFMITYCIKSKLFCSIVLCLISLVCNWMHVYTEGKSSTLFLINSLQCVAYLIDQGCTDKLCYSKWQLWANILWRKIGYEIIQDTWSKEISPVLVAKKELWLNKYFSVLLLD